MAGIINGQSVDAANSNAAWLSKNGNDTTIGELGLNNSAASSGPAITNAQGAINKIITGVGGNQYTAPTAYGALPASTISGLTHEQALGVFARLFHASTGHKHTGADGDGPPITAVLSIAPTGGTGITGDVRLVPGTKISLSQFGQGITINANPYSLAEVLTVGNTATAGIDFSGGAIAGLSYMDVFTSGGLPPSTPAANHMYIAASGDNHLYYKTSASATRRIDTTFAASGNSALYGDVVLAASGATVLSQSGQVITVYAPASGTAVNSIAASGSTALTGAVLIAASGAAQVSESGQVITVYAPASGAAVNSFAASGQSALTGAVTISASGAATLTQSGQNISIYAPASGTAVNTLAASGSSGLTGAVTISASGAAQVTQSGQNIQVYAPASGAAVNSLAASGSSALTGAVTIAASGVAQVTQSGQTITVYAPAAAASGAAVNSLAASGQTGLTGAVTLSASGATVLTQSGQNIQIYSPASGAAVNSFAASGSTALTGAVTISASGAASLTQTGQNISIYAPASGTAVNTLAASGSSGLTGAVVIAASGGAQVTQSGQTITVYAPTGGSGGVTSIAASGQAGITGAATLSASGGIVLTQSGQNIQIYAPTGGGGSSSLGMVAACQLVPNTFWSTSVGTSYTTIGTVGSITFTSTSGISTASAPATNVPGFKVASLVPGTYKITAIGSFGSSGSAGYAFTIYDGTNYGQSNVAYIVGGSNCVPQVICYFTYASTQTNIQFQLAARTQSGSITAVVSNQQSNSMDLNFIIERIY